MATRPGLVVELLAVPKAVQFVRHAVHDHLGKDSPDVELCVSELLSNVIRHLGAGTPVTVRVAEGDGLVRVEVSDPAPGELPPLVESSPDDEGGRGLALVEAVAERWGVRQGGSGKTVWCELGGS